MPSKSDIAITLGVKDLATPAIDQVVKHLTGLERPAKRAESNLAGALNADGVQKITAGFRDMSFHVRDVVRQTTALVPPLAAITSAASIAGVGALASQYANLGAHLKTISTRAGVPIQQLQHLQDAVQLGGGDPNAMAGALTRLHDAQRGFLDGTDPAALAAFASINFKRYDVDVPVADLFERVQKRIQEVSRTDPMRAETKVGIPLLGGDYSSIAPAITRPNWRHYEDEAASLNPGLTGDQADGADALREKLTALEVQIKGIGLQIGGDLAAPLASVATALEKSSMTINRRLATAPRSSATG